MILVAAMQQSVKHEQKRKLPLRRKRRFRFVEEIEAAAPERHAAEPDTGEVEDSGAGVQDPAVGDPVRVVAGG